MTTTMMDFMSLFRNSILECDGNNNSAQGKKRRFSEAEEWYFRLLNDPQQFKKERYI
jgi:hypothetical protein